MNALTERGREALIQAALKGVPQIRGNLHDGKGGHCAWGIIHLDLHQGDELTALRCIGKMGAPRCGMREAYLQDDEITLANDVRGWDFLTIAHKCGEDAS